MAFIRPNFESFYKFQTFIIIYVLALWRNCNSTNKNSLFQQWSSFYFYTYIIFNVTGIIILCTIQIIIERRDITAMIRVFFMYATILSSTLKLLVL